MQNTEIIVAIAAMAFTAVALRFDLRVRKIPNALTVSAFAAAIVFHLIANGISGLGFALAGFAAGFLPLLVLWLIGGGGGGDVKMMGALGAWIGAPQTLIVFVGSAGVALIFVFGAMVYKSIAKPAATTSAGNVDVQHTKMDQAQRLLPYAVPVTIMTWAWFVTKMTLAIAA